jgi:hypothetical protein
MFSEEREQKLKERLLAAFELARTAKLKPKAEAEKSKSWFSGLIDQKVELVFLTLEGNVDCRWLVIPKSFSRIS